MELPAKRLKLDDSPWERLPSETLAEIFGNLSEWQLKTARLVCRRWYETVANFPVIQGKLLLTIPISSRRSQESCQELNEMARQCNRYTQVRIARLRDEEAIALKPLLGGNIRQLDLFCCQLTAQELFRMLADLPKLYGLKFSVDPGFNYDLHDIVHVSDSLVRSGIEKLQLILGDHDEFLDLFRVICPRLKVLLLRLHVNQYHGEEFGASLVRFISGVKSTLRTFHYPNCSNYSLLKQILSTDGLVLQHLQVGALEDDTAIAEFCRLQPMLEALRVEDIKITKNEVLSSISRLPNLKKINIFVESLPMHFLSSMQRLESLTLSYCGTVFDRNEVTLPNLKSLSLEHPRLSCPKLQQLVVTCPNIDHLSLCAISGICVHDILVITSSLKSLRKLSLQTNYRSGVHSSQHHGYSFRPVWNLLELELDGDFNFCLDSRLAAAVQKYPQLQKFGLSYACYGHEAMRLLIQALKNVSELSFRQCNSISDIAIKHIGDHCQALQKLTIDRCMGISRAAVKRFRAAYQTCKVILKEDEASNEVQEEEDEEEML